MIRKKQVPSNFKNRLSKLKSVLVKYPIVYALFLFGSQAEERSTALSDVNIAYLSYQNLDYETESNLLFDIDEILGTEEVDLVNIKKMPLVSTYKIVNFGKLIFCSDEKAFLDYKERINIKYFDFKPYHDEYMECFKQRLKQDTVF